MYYKRILPFIIALMAFPFLSNAQVTTSSITGSVKTATGEALEGATITATHQPSGSIYTTIAKKGGTFTLSNLRIGGPYVLKVNFVGLKTELVQDINLSLGEPYNANIVLSDELKTLT
ncbi:MAG TPA: carboxypeptidase-like regulatory domain-containing protein, partial [Chitinophagaceae bacterium]